MTCRLASWLRIAIIGCFLAGLVFPAGAALATRARGSKINIIHQTGTIIYSDWEFPDTLNPMQTGSGSSFETIDSTLSGLAVFNGKSRLQPDMLVNLPSVKNHEILNHGRTIILKLKPHIYWSSGSEITSKDIVFGWKMYMNAATGPACTGTCDHIASITTPSRYEAVLKMRSAYAPVLAYGLPPVWPHNWSALGTTPDAAAKRLADDTSFNFENPSYWTDGPYQVQQFINNDRIVLTPMKYYHIHPGPYVAKLIFEAFANKAAMIAAAGSNQIDDSTDYTPADLKLLHSYHHYKVLVTPSFLLEHLEFNALDPTYKGQPNPLHDVRVRQALALDTDRVGLIQSSQGTNAAGARSIVAYSPFTITKHFVQQYGDKSIKGAWDPIAKRYLTYGKRAVADARTLLKQAGYSHGFHLEFLTTAGNPARQAEYGVLSQNWAALGVTTTFDTTTALLAPWEKDGLLAHGNYQVSLWTEASGADPDAFKAYWDSHYIDRAKATHSAINANFSGIQNKLIDQGLQRGASTFNPKQRAKWYRQVQVAMVKGAYWVPLFYRANIVTSDHHIAGDTGYGLDFGNEWNTYHWHYVGG